jgi:hypothetical protein
MIKRGALLAFADLAHDTTGPFPLSRGFFRENPPGVFFGRKPLTEVQRKVTMKLTKLTR